MKKKGRFSQSLFVPALAQNTVHPFNINMLDYFAFYNNADSLRYCLKWGAKYKRNIFGKSPLEYSIARMSIECT